MRITLEVNQTDGAPCSLVDRVNHTRGGAFGISRFDAEFHFHISEAASLIDLENFLAPLFQILLPHRRV